MKQNFFSLQVWLLRVKYALNGFVLSFRTEHTVWLHMAATIAVIILSIAGKVTVTEAIALIFSAGFVWTAELFNTAIEKLADKVTMDYSEQIKLVKDLSAAAVLVSSVVALTTGLIIFIPKFI